MTAPVQQQSSGADWKISFVMPSEYTMDTLPKPFNERIMLKETTPKTLVVITFSGKNSDKNLEDNKNQLLEYVRSNDLSIVGTPKYAFYNPPWTLSPMRRNEIMIEIKE